MKVDKIIPCVCCDHEPDCGDSVYYGMPQLKVCGGKPHTYFEVYCPNCGRGGLFQFKSAYLALKHWNEMQERLRTPINLFVDDNPELFKGGVECWLNVNGALMKYV